MRLPAAAGHAPLTLTVAAVDPSINPTTRLASVFVRLPANSGIAPGEAVAVTVPVAGGGSGLVIPYAALLDDGGQPYVFVVSGGKAHRRDVVPGPVGGGQVGIARGLADGDLVVVEGGTALDDGMPVRTR